MKEQSTGNKIIYRAGNSTLEILIAFAVLTLCMTAVIMVIFGNQSVSVDTETNNEGLSKAIKTLEDARANSRRDFLSVVSFATTSTSTIAYNQKLEVLDISECKKQATSTVTWFLSPTRQQKIELTTFFSSTSTVLSLGGDCVVDLPQGNWQNFASQSGGDGSVNGTDIDVQNSIVYVTANSTSGVKPDLLVYSFNPISKVITDRGTLDLSSGFNSIDVAGKYAYVANNESEGHLQVIDISNIDNIPPPVASSTLPGMSSGIGRSIYYFNNRVYIGTQYLPCPSCTPEKNNELHIYDVSSSTNPQWRDSINVDRNVNAIVVRNGLAYVATGSGSTGVHNPLKIYDVNQLSPKYKMQIASTSATGDEAGLSIALLGNRLYLGLERTTSGRPNFFIYDVSSSTNPTNCLTCSRSFPGEDITGISVVGNFAFLSSDNNLEVLNISNPASIVVVKSIPLAKSAPAIDFENNFVFIPYIKQGPATMSIFYPGP
jgi:hypothetical protein